MSGIVYPEMLYKFRGSGLVPYKHIDSNIYEDTTCKNHLNCRISVKMVGDHFEFEECVNDSAREYDYFHKRLGNDTDFYEDKEAARRAWFQLRIDSERRSMEKYINDVEEEKAELKKMRKKKLRPQSIFRMDFEYPIIIANRDYYGDVTSIVREEAIEHKVFGKDGLEYLLTNQESRITDNEHQLFMNVSLLCEDFEGSNYHEGYVAFYSREDYDAYLYNKKIEKLKKSQESVARNLAQYEKDIKELEAEMNRESYGDVPF